MQEKGCTVSAHPLHIAWKEEADAAEPLPLEKSTVIRYNKGPVDKIKYGLEKKVSNPYFLS